jgi:E3 SUMO-protein ligase PIAS1
VAGIDEDVVVDVVKVPLMCPLGSRKMELPARGVFCSHYTCFDLYNYLRTTAQNYTNRWICPECKRPCYQFKIDSILLAILEGYGQHDLSEVLFFRNGGY